MNPFELIKLVTENFPEGEAQLTALAALADAPGEDYQAKIRLPVQNEVPSFKIGDGSLGSLLANQNYGVAGPVLGQEMPKNQTIGQMLVGEM